MPRKASSGRPNRASDAWLTNAPSPVTGRLPVQAASRLAPLSARRTSHARPRSYGWRLAGTACNAAKAFSARIRAAIEGGGRRRFSPAHSRQHHQQLRPPIEPIEQGAGPATVRAGEAPPGSRSVLRAAIGDELRATACPSAARRGPGPSTRTKASDEGSGPRRRIVPLAIRGGGDLLQGGIEG